MTYLVTFHTHFGAMSYQRECKANGLDARMMPVPRSVSASCGVCVRLQLPQPPPVEDAVDWEGLYQEEQGEYTLLLQGD